MPYLKTFVSISLDYPVYVKVPAGLDYDSINDLIEETSPCAWAFAFDDVVSDVSKAIPIAQDVTPDVGASDDVFDSYPEGSLVYDVNDISGLKAVQAFVIERKAIDLKQKIEDALYYDDFDEVVRLGEELRRIGR